MKTIIEIHNEIVCYTNNVAMVEKVLYVKQTKMLEAMSEVERQTREEMFEFVEYCIINVSVAKKGYCTMSDNFDKDFVSKEELFDYFKSLKK
jgi:hypothetical protein